jgi:ATP-dependent Lon protease
MKPNIIIEKIETISKKLLSIENKINKINDNYEILDNNMEDIYDTINTINTDNSDNSDNIEKNNDKNKSSQSSQSQSSKSQSSKKKSSQNKSSIKKTNTNNISKSHYNFRNKKRKYGLNDSNTMNDIIHNNNINTTEDNYEDEDEDDYETEDETEDETDDETDDETEAKTNTTLVKNIKFIKTYITNYIKNIKNTKNIKHKYDEKYKYILKEQALKFYNNLITNNKDLELTQLYENINYFINETPEQRISILEKFDAILNLSNNKEPKIFKIMKSSLDTYYKKVALNKLQLLDKMKSGESEYFKLTQWIDTFLDIPFNIYKTPKYMDQSILISPSNYLTDAQQHLDKVIYGQQNTKNHIIEILAKMITNPKTMGSVFAIQGAAGTGKTTLIKDGLSEVFGLPFIFISLGGTQDRTFLTGSNYVYEGSACGKIIQSLKQSQCMNPIFYFDELDKVSNTDKGQEIINVLIHLTDYTQNSHFMDDYMDGIVVDLSRATFIFSFNDKSKISPILLDRMEIISFSSYSFTEKMHIAKSFLLPTIIQNIFGEKKDTIQISDDQLKTIINLPFYKKTQHTTQNTILNTTQNTILNTTQNTTQNTSNNKIYNKLINKNKKKKYKSNTYGGVRYIKKKLEKIVSKMNVDLIMKKK